MQRINGRLALTALVGCLVIYFLVSQYRSFMLAGKAEETQWCMVQLHQILTLENPSDLGTETLDTILSKHQRLKCGADAWGGRFLVERESQQGNWVYTLRSLGRDKELGSCCRGLAAGDWDADAVLKDGKWMQAWAHVQGKPGA